MATKERRPKSANGNGGASKRADGTWQWRISLPDGRRVYGYGKDQAEARQRCLEKVALADQGVDYRAARQKVDDYSRMVAGGRGGVPLLGQDAPHLQRLGPLAHRA